MRFLIATVLSISFLFAQEQEAKKPLVKKISDEKFEVGLIKFDAKTRVISVPVEVNQNEDLVEYLLVTDKGKTHEALLLSKAEPSHLQIALKLLKYQSGEGDIFDRLLPSTDRKIKGNKSKQTGTAVALVVTWKNGEEEKSELINKWILSNQPNEITTMAEHPWNYTGSVIHGGKFLADVEGSVIAIYLDPTALFNTSVPGSESDERWTANTAAIPEVGTQAILQIIPQQ